LTGTVNAQGNSYVDTIYQAGQSGESDYQYDCASGTCSTDDEKCTGEECADGQCEGTEVASETCKDDNCPDGKCVDGKCVKTPEKKLKTLLEKLRDVLTKLINVLLGNKNNNFGNAKVIDIKNQPKPKVEKPKIEKPKVEKPKVEKPTQNKFKEYTDFEAAKKAAKEKGHPIMMVFEGSDWCGWCKKFNSEILTQPEFKDYAKDNMETFVADFPDKLHKRQA